MTDDRARKKAVRRRMAQTGEKYTEARRALEDAPSDPKIEAAHVEDPVGRGQFGRFTEGARRVVALARDEARTLKHPSVGTEHILLGLAREDDGAAARILLDFDADTDKLHNEVIRSLSGPGGLRSSIGAAESARASSDMLEHLSERARDVIDGARREARALGHGHIGGEHILLGLLREPEGLAGRALEALGVTLEQARARVVERVPSGKPALTGQRPLTPSAKRIVERALREALSLGRNLIGTEHILLGLVRETRSTAHAVLLDLDADPDKVRSEIFDRLSRAGSDAPVERAEPGRLTAQAEVELMRRIERGDPEAKEHMARRSAHLVASIADEYRGEGLPLEALKQAGSRGLDRAIDTFDYRRGHRFSSYATRWIRQAVLRALTERSG